MILIPVKQQKIKILFHLLKMVIL